MKYNPTVNEEIAALPGFAGIHPLQPEDTVQGCLEALDLAAQYLCEITGMDAMTFQPAAGAHGEFTGLLLIKAYHQARGDERPRPKSSSRTLPTAPTPPPPVWPASTWSAFPPLAERLCRPRGAARRPPAHDTAGLMLTNPNTVGLFDQNILEITRDRP